MTSEYEEVKYTIEINWTLCIGEGDPDRLAFYKIFFNSLLKKIRYKQIGRNFFNPLQSKSMGPSYNIEIWPGFSSSLQLLESGVLLNIDMCHKIIRTDSVLDQINDIKARSRGDPRDEIKRALIGSTIMSSYNKRMYKIDDIDFNLSPAEKFST